MTGMCVCVCLVRPAGSGMWKANPEMFESTQLIGATFLFLVDVALSATTSETCHSQSHQHQISATTMSTTQRLFTKFWGEKKKQIHSI